jgi:amino acid adenylation domain-containing protein
VSLPLRTFFEKTNLAELAQCVETARHEASSTHMPAIGSVSRGPEIPLGFSQERVWFLQQLDPSSIAYHFQATLHIQGPLNVLALERSLTEMVRRHEIFRTTFTEKDERAIQIVHEPVPASFSVTPLRNLERHARDEATEKIIHEEMSRRFDVSQLPLIRWVLLSFSEEEHLLLHVEHHFVHDGWSFNLFLGEFLEMYKAFASGQPSPLAPPRFQFADFAVWQREHVRSLEVQAQLSYWKKKLAGSPPISELPTDHPRSRVQTFHGGLRRVPLSAELSRSLHVFSNQEDASLFVIMMSAFFALAYQYTRQPEFCVGTSLANRQRPETEGVLGMLVNNVVLRSQMPANAGIRDLLSQVRSLTFEAYENQDVPFQEVVKSLNVNRDLSVNPLFQTTFNFHNSPVFVPEIPELKLKLQEALGNGAAKFDLGIIVIPASTQRLRLNPEWDKDAVTMLWEYNSDLFEDSTVQRIITHYQQILQSMMADPEQKVAEICLLTEEERRQVLVDWNQTGKEVSFGECIHELFSRQARQAPAAFAVAYKSQTLTYMELNRKANQLARYLRRRGVGPEVRVGLCMDRRPEMVVSMLGILKAGGCYVPLDASYPATRLEYMVQDAQLKLLLGEQRIRSKPEGTESKWISVDDQLWDEIAKESDQDFESGVSPENLAYVIYTSGSTGRPKGVGVPHRGLANLVAWHQEAYRVTAADRATQVASGAFDASVWELWPYLLSGSCVDLPEAEILESPAMLLEWLAIQEISICFLPTPLAEVLTSTPLPAGLKLRDLLTGGDRLHPDKWSDFPFRVTNHYGPTENTVVTTCARAKSGNLPPIGKPITNTRVYVLDENFQPVAIGVAGELHIGGRSLARGYVKRPDLTAERFVPDPFSGLSGERLYRTGDVVRYLANGDLEFIGRKDQQIKLRGYRIELGEIEATLLDHPHVQHAIAALREESNGERRLVAYFVADRQAVDSDELRAYLQQKLPGYMVPSAYMELEEIPLTPNGKVDREALPAPKRDTKMHRPPRNAQEELLCGIFAKVLSLEQVGVDDDFFALGGHSLTATQVASQVRRALGVDLSVRAIFDAPTVAQLSHYLESDRHPPLYAAGYADPSGITRRVKNATGNA